MGSIETVFESVMVREITNGMLFFACMFLLAPLMEFLRPKLRFKVWRQTIDVRLAWALSLLIMGSVVRAGWVWLLLMARHRGWHGLEYAMVQAGWIGYLAVVLMLWGVVCTKKTIRQAQNGDPRAVTPSTVLMIATAIIIPVAFYVF